MNIFVLSSDPKEIARYQNDKHCVKMILESTQMLSTVHRIRDGIFYLIKKDLAFKRDVKRWLLPDSRNEVLYQATHMNHPCTIWSMESSGNYLWHVNLLKEMCKEYTYRYGKVHKCEGIIPYLVLPDSMRYMNLTKMTPFAIAMPDDCKIDNDPIKSYRNYYIKNKMHIAKWTKREIPDWFNHLHLMM